MSGYGCYIWHMKRNAATQSPETLRRLARLGTAIRAARARRRLTQDQVADRAGLTRRTLMRLEHGDPGVAVGSFLEVLAVLEGEWPDQLVEPLEVDAPGRALEDARLPSRVVSDGF